MRKDQIDQLLLRAVADAIGQPLPRKRRATPRKAVAAHAKYAPPRATRVPEHAHA